MRARATVAAAWLLASAGVAEAAPRGDPRPSVAVFDFASGPEHGELSSLLADAVSGALSSSGKVAVLERRRVAEVLRDRALWDGGELDDASAARLGRAAGATRLVLGRLSRQGSGFRAEARLLDAGDARPLAAAEALFKTREAIPIAARELAAALFGESHHAAFDEARLREAAEELARRIGQRFPRARTRLLSVDPQGWATLSGGTARGIVPGLRMEVYGRDFVTGERELRGYLLVKESDREGASGPSRALTEPLRVGDEVVSRAVSFRVEGGPGPAAKTLADALRAIGHFASAEGIEPPVLSIVLETQGQTSGGRRLRARLADRSGTSVDEVESSLTF